LIKGNVIPNSIVDVRIVKKKKDFLTGEVVAIKHYDPEWVDESHCKCEHYRSPLQPQAVDHNHGCGGCKRQVIPYLKQLEIKESILHDCFRRVLPKLHDTTIYPIIPSPTEYGYRNKIEMSFGQFGKH
jgi:23S rRNA (uracil1939-C5)-methyltransferase